jgi:hypothetical protein
MWRYAIAVSIGPTNAVLFRLRLISKYEYTGITVALPFAAAVFGTRTAREFFGLLSATLALYILSTLAAFSPRGRAERKEAASMCVYFGAQALMFCLIFGGLSCFIGRFMPS